MTAVTHCGDSMGYRETERKVGTVQRKRKYSFVFTVKAERLGNKNAYTTELTKVCTYIQTDLGGRAG